MSKIIHSLMGPFPAVGKLWHDAIMNGYYLK